MTVDQYRIYLQSGSAEYSAEPDRKSTRLNSSHGYISYAVFCLKKKIRARARGAGAGSDSDRDVRRESRRVRRGPLARLQLESRNGVSTTCVIRCGQRSTHAMRV